MDNAAEVRAVQQALLWQDATLPNVQPARDGVGAARVTASSSAAEGPAGNILDGMRRDRIDARCGELLACHAWRSGPLASGPQWVEVGWDQPATISQVMLIFDSGFQRELTLSASDHVTRSVIRGPQPETVRDYVLSIDGRIVAEVSGNYQRRRVHSLDRPVAASRLRLTVTASNGSPEARVFEIAVR
jgi:hypothetical protein